MKELISAVAIGKMDKTSRTDVIKRWRLWRREAQQIYL
jgi:hypothetical protein